jgi:hypothetical protein
MLPRLEPFEQLKHARKQFAFATGQFQRKKMHVTIEERTHIFSGRRDVMLVQNADDNSRVGHPGYFNIAQIVITTETFFERRSKRMHTRAA